MLLAYSNNFTEGVKLWVLTFALLCSSYSGSAQTMPGFFIVKGKVASQFVSDPIPFASISLQSVKKNYTVIANENGEFIFKLVPEGLYTLVVSSINYKLKKLELQISSNQVLEIKLEPQQQLLNEVYITASEAKGKSSTSVIDRKAMQLLQPSSFTDLLELLPGGRSVDPKLNIMNQIQIRVPKNYTAGDDMSSLGTAFYIDGAPINTSANLQSTDGFTLSDPNIYRNTTNKGVDMRSISTDQIEKVEIVRGIPSAEFGDLTSGLVKIERKKGATPYTARMKADGFSKLFSIGKGVSFLEKNLYINANVDFLDSKADPRDNFENYSRITGSVRTERFWENKKLRFTWNASFDYATTVDNQRTDPDNSYTLTDDYTSEFKSYALANTFKFKFNKSILKGLDVTTRLSYQNDVIEMTKWIQARTATILVNSLIPGEHDAKYATPYYVSALDVIGKPLTAFAKVAATFEKHTGKIHHNLRTGVEWNYSKNFGAGQLYDLDLPPSTGISVRPRAFHEIPALNNVALFAEEATDYNIGKHLLKLTMGLRGMSLINIDSKYKIANQLYLDPRVNLLWDLPDLTIGGRKLALSFGGGFGLHNKLPTLDMLFPAPDYIDNVQLNYYHNNPAFRRANALTTITDRVNYDLVAAMNKKWEFNIGADYEGYRFSITYFREKMTSGFRDNSKYRKINYKVYDNASIDANALTGKPELNDFTYTNRSEFYGYSTKGNGAGIAKEGIEYQFTTKRLSLINTRFTLNGAWFNNRYFGSVANYGIISTSIITEGKVRQYLGLYDVDEGSNYQQFNTNLIIDSYLPKLGLVLSASLQNLWFTSRKENFNTGTPIAYMDIDEVLHPYTEASKIDQNLRWLQENYTESNFRRDTVPLDLQVNLKASKDFKNKARISMFVNRFLTYRPSYISYYGATIVRQGSSPYFGMEITFNL